MAFLTFAALFYAAAEYEHMTGWKWALASLAVTATVQRLFALSFILILPAQFGLFCVLWWANIQRKKKFEVERAARAEEDRRMRQDRATRAREKAERDQAQPDPARAAREAKESEETRMRQERVRRVREEREQAERDSERDKENQAQ
jgi:flagellar biosynthesis GTPase FlhF